MPSGKNTNSLQLVAMFHLKRKVNIMYAAILIIILSTVSDAVEEVDILGNSYGNGGCSDTSDTILRVTLGWPLQIDCQEVMSAVAYYSYYAHETNREQKALECVVSSGEVIVHRANVTVPDDGIAYIFEAPVEPYVIEAVSEEQNGTVFTTNLVGVENCSQSFILIVEKPGLELSCDKASFENEWTRELILGDLFLLSCLADKNTFFLDTDKYVVTWYKDCQEIKTVTKTERNAVGDFVEVDQFQITKANFKTTPGEYKCSVKYKGYERFLTKSNVCVKYATPEGPPDIRQITPKETTESVGKNVTLTCGGFANTASQISFAIMWLKNLTDGAEERICTEYFGTGIAEDDGKYHCNLLTNADAISTCYTNDEEAMEDQYRGILRVNSSLTIRDFQETDAGEYICRVLSTRQPENVAFSVQLKTGGQLIIILGSVIGILALLLICLILAVCIRRGNFQKTWQKAMENSTSATSSVDSRDRHEKEPKMLPETETQSFPKKELPQCIV